MSLQGQVALVTGSGSSTSAGTANTLATAGVNLAILITDRQTYQAAQGLAAAYPKSRITMHTGSLTDPTSIETIFSDVLAKQGRVDMVVNEAGSVLRKPTAQSGDGGAREGLLSYMTFVDAQARETERRLREEAARHRGGSR